MICHQGTIAHYHEPFSPTNDHSKPSSRIQRNPVSNSHSSSLGLSKPLPSSYRLPCRNRITRLPIRYRRVQALQFVLSWSDALLVSWETLGRIGFLIIACLGEADLDGVGVVFGVEGCGKPVDGAIAFVGALWYCL